MDSTNKSEVAKIRERIALEYEAAKHVFEGFSQTASHAFITARQENIEACYTELIQHMTPAEAVQIMMEVEKGIYSALSSSGNTS